MSDIDASNEVQLTDTPDKIELDPTISPDMTKIAYRNYASDGNFIEILDFGEVLK
jgi:Tol biopolymer transport system component